MGFQHPLVQPTPPRSMSAGSVSGGSSLSRSLSPHHHHRGGGGLPVGVGGGAYSPSGGGGGRSSLASSSSSFGGRSYGGVSNYRAPY